MRRRVAAVVCAGALAALAGCADWRRQPPAPRLSIKDDAPPKAELSVPPKRERSGPSRTELPAPPKVELSVEERARREQANWCGQRHVEHNAGTLEESEEQKRVRDSQCTELHKRDYVR